MPSIDKPAPNLNELDSKSTNSPALIPLSTDPEEWTAPTLTKKVGKKGKKSKKNAPASRPSEYGDDSPAQPNSLASSPPDPILSKFAATIPPETAIYEDDQETRTSNVGRDIIQDDSEAPETRIHHTTRELEDLLLDDVPLQSDDHGITQFSVRGTTQPQPIMAEASSKEPDVEHLAHFTNIPNRPVSIPTPNIGSSPSPAAMFFSRSPSIAAGSLRARSFQNNFLLSSSPPPPPQQQQQYQTIDSRPQPVTKSPTLEAPLPHKIQNHFFSVPELGLNLNAKQELGKPAGSDGCCCCFDSFAEAGNATAASRARDVLLVGSEGGLDVYRIVSDKLEVIGRLEGLRGAILGAKILPRSVFRYSRHRSGLLVAVVIHGLARKERLSAETGENGQNSWPLYQTSVEIYSLTNHEYIATLYEGVPEPNQIASGSTASSFTRSTEDFQLDAKGNFITLASGKSGEIWVFGECGQSERGLDFRCLAKFWTALQTSQDVTNSPQQSDQRASVAENSRRQPLYSVSNRWLAIVPPYTSAGTALRGSSAPPRTDWPVPGYQTQLAPVQPSITCEVAGIDAEGTLSWLSRKAAQGLVKASQKGYEISVQGWKELTNPTAPASHNGLPTNGGDVFPPTNAPAEDPRRLSKEPALVSIIDLDQLLHPWDRASSSTSGLPATFALVDGCNHLSFSSDGTKLLTVNRKGETYTVWDLQYVAHGKTRFNTEHDSAFERGPHIRQIHRVNRSSPSTVLESVWSRDADRLALLTGHGTIHLHEIASKIVDSKRRRRSTMNNVKSEKAEPTVGMSQGMSPPSSNSFWNTVRSGMQSVGAQVNAIRTHSSGLPTTFAGFREVTAAAGQAGGRAVAKGFSHGYSAAKGGASDIWHAEDNKIRQKALQNVVTGKAVLRWVQRKGDTFLAVVCGGIVHLYPVQQEVRRKSNFDVTGLRKFAPRMFTLPRIAVQEDSNKCSGEGPHGFWTLHETEPLRPRARDPPPSLATDIESNPPYCPFHVDSRVSIFAFDDGLNASQIYKGNDLPWRLRGHGVTNETAWTFGDPLPPSVRINSHDNHDLDETERAFDAEGMDNAMDEVESRLTIRSTSDGVGGDNHIRVNTRRTRTHDESHRKRVYGPSDDYETQEVEF